MRGWALAAQGEAEQSMAQIRQGLAAWQAMGQRVVRSYWLALLADACGYIGQVAEGLQVVTEALATVSETEECFYEAVIHRLKGELLLKQAMADEEQAESASSRPSPWLAASRRNPWSCGQP